MLRKEIKTALLTGAGLLTNNPETKTTTSMYVKLSERAPVFSPLPCILQPAQSAKGMPSVFAFCNKWKQEYIWWILKHLQQLKVLLSAKCLFLYLKERLLCPQLNYVQGAHALFMLPWQGMNSHNLRALTEELYWILLQCFKMFNTFTASCSCPRDYCLHSRHVYLILSWSHTDCSNHLDHHQAGIWAETWLSPEWLRHGHRHPSAEGCYRCRSKQMTMLPF